MIVTNAVYPTESQFNALLSSDLSGPVCMVNLLRFKERAEYTDGRESGLSGQEAYGLYGEQMRPFVESRGGRFIFYGGVKQLMIGEVEAAWDSVAVVEYPSKEEFVAIVTAPDVQEFGVHRAAGLEGQLLIATQSGSQ